MSPGPLRPTTTSLTPSGAHWKPDAPFSRLVTRLGSPPPSDNSHTCVRGVSVAESVGIGRADRKAIALPSGLHRGLFDDCGAVVSSIGSREPSAGTDQMALRRRFCFWSTVV